MKFSQWIQKYYGHKQTPAGDLAKCVGMWIGLPENETRLDWMKYLRQVNASRSMVSTFVRLWTVYVDTGGRNE